MATTGPLDPRRPRPRSLIICAATVLTGLALTTGPGVADASVTHRPDGTGAGGSPSGHADPAAVLTWNAIAVRTELAAAQSIQEGLFQLAYVQAAVQDAVVAVDGGSRPYVGRLRATGPADGDAAVAAAAHAVLVARFPAQTGTLDEEYARALAARPAGPATDRGVRIGEAAAREVLRARASDGFQSPATYTFGSGPGVWVLPTDNPATTPATPWVAQMTPFVLRHPQRLLPGPGPALTSAAYTASFTETKAYGSATSTVRTAEQTRTALFWGLGRPDAQFPAALRDVITRTGMDRAQAARALALGGLATADAIMLCMDAKYTYSRWRPFTAIRGAATDGNPATVEDPSWTPLVRTPNHPEYPANHPCVTAAFARTVQYLLGGRPFQVTLSGAPASTDTRTFTSADALVAESGNARIWGGIHFRYSTDAGARIGRLVADRVVCQTLRPVGRG